MHANIYQLSDEPIAADDRICESTFYDGGCSYHFFDYCTDLYDEEREEAIQTLVDCIAPEGMFTFLTPDTLRYNGGAEAWKAAWVERIHGKAKAVNADNVTDFVGAAYYLKREIDNPLGIDDRFFIDGRAEQSDEVIRMLCRFKKGDILYFGGVLDFHH